MANLDSASKSIEKVWTIDSVTWSEGPESMNKLFGKARSL